MNGFEDVELTAADTLLHDSILDLDTLGRADSTFRGHGRLEKPIGRELGRFSFRFEIERADDWSLTDDARIGEFFFAGVERIGEQVKFTSPLPMRLLVQSPSNVIHK